jgi:hypothetical protein
VNPLSCRAQSSCEAGALTIEIELRVETEASPCIKRIVDVRRDDGSEAFYLGQWKSSLIVRSFNTFDDVAGEFIVDLSGSANDLWKPVRLVFDKRPLGLPGVPSFPGSDVPVNLLGFVPFGFLVCLRLLTAGKPSPRGCLFLAVALGFAVSLAIELTQVWLPGRDSSLLDLTMNTVGSAIGGAMAFYLGRAYGKLLK